MLKLFDKNDSTAALFTSTFFFSAAHGGIFTLAIPFVVTVLGGTDKDVGLCSGLGMTGYLVSCLLVAEHLDRFNAKRTLQVSSGVITLCTVMIYVITEHFRDGIWGLNAIAAVTGLNIVLSFMLAMLWPPIMGWVSVGYEGQVLSRRLGKYNITWSLSLVVAPLAAGYIIQINPGYGIAATAVCAIIAFGLLSSAKKPEHHKSIKTTEYKTSETHKSTPIHGAFIVMSRIGLAVSCIALGLIRTQFALLFTEDLGHSESLFGYVTMSLCLANFAGFYITGINKKWHHKIVPFIACHFIIATGMIIILSCKSLVPLFAAVMLIGFGQSFAYASHQYYSVSGKAKRSGSMAIHEMLISMGYASGSIVGGFLGEYSRYWPYWMGLGVVVISVAAEMVVFHKSAKLKIDNG